MHRISATLRISFSLVCLTLSVLFVARLLGLLPDAAATRLEGRKALCEAIAIDCSLAAERGNLNAIQRSLTAITGRNSDIRGARLRSSSGNVLVEVGNSQSGTSDTAESDADLSAVIEVPIVAGGSPWGQVEIAFSPLSSGGLWGILLSPTTILTLFIASSACLLFFLYLRRVLTHLDPSRVVPQRVRRTLDTMAEGLIVVDTRGRIVLANEAFASVVGTPCTDLQGRPAADLPWSGVTPGDDQLTFPWERALDQRASQTGAVLKMETESAGLRTFRVNSAPITNEQGSCQGVLTSFDDVTALEKQNAALTVTLTKLKQSRDQIHRQNKELTVLATRDSLTGCLNRRSFFEQFEQRFQRARKHCAELSCVMLDIDFFKSINDNHGHGKGDEVLKMVADVVKSSVRDCDLVCRYGGEEFSIVLPELNLEEAALVAEKCREQIEAASTDELHLSASLGVADLEEDVLDLQQLLDRADKSLYLAKRSGRNQVIRWDEVPEDLEVDESLVSRTTLADEDEDAAIPFHAVTALISALAYRDASTADHSRRVADLCVATADGLMSLSDAYVLEIAALLHDIGKIGVPDSILLKPGALTKEEWKMMHKHDRIGIEIIESTFASPRLTEIVSNHHADFGGNSGHPHMPVGEDIPLGARIITIADAYDAMVSDRVYRKGISQKKAFAELRRCSGTQFDPELVERFIEVVLGRCTQSQRESVTISKQAALRIGMQIENLAAAIDNQDADSVAALAGRLHATATKDGVSEIAELASQLESNAEEDQDWIRILDLTNGLLQLCRSTQRTYLDAPDSGREEMSSDAEPVAVD